MLITGVGGRSGSGLGRCVGSVAAYGCRMSSRLTPY